MKLNYKRTILVGFAFFLISAFWQAYDATIPVILTNKFGMSQTLSGVIMAAKLLMVFHGKRYRSVLLKRIAFAGYNKKCGKGCDPNAWLSRDGEVVSQYHDDPLCGYVFTLSAYHDLFTLVETVSHRDWAGRLPKELPLLLISGEDDPVGGFGKGVRAVEKRLRAVGISDLTAILYPNMRHEILNEIEHETVWSDIKQWLEQKLP